MADLDFADGHARGEYAGTSLVSHLRYVDPAHDHTKSLQEALASTPEPEPEAPAEGETATEYDPVNHPKHYTSDPSGVECIQITRHRSFNIGNAIKYLWRAGLKGDGEKAKHIEDLEKVLWYVRDEIALLKGEYAE
ncbi:DUF3310 domain-containing protein [Rhodococcus sp. 11-3]|nr:DUF3310 domain-containing protein [Rhodococcus sp. 11-3]